MDNEEEKKRKKKEDGGGVLYGSEINEAPVKLIGSDTINQMSPFPRLLFWSGSSVMWMIQHRLQL